MAAQLKAGVDAATWLQVGNFLTDYAHRLDDGRVDEWTGFFTHDALYQITTRENFEAGYPIGIMLCTGRGMMEDRVLALKTANVFEPHTHCHILGQPALEQVAPGVVGARSNFSVYRTMESGGTEVFAIGKYLDRIVFEGGQPRFAERRVILDSRCIDVLMVLPL